MARFVTLGIFSCKFDVINQRWPFFANLSGYLYPLCLFFLWWVCCPLSLGITKYGNLQWNFSQKVTWLFACNSKLQTKLLAVISSATRHSRVLKDAFLCVRALQIALVFESAGFSGEGKTGLPKLSHIGGRQTPSLLHQPCYVSELVKIFKMSYLRKDQSLLNLLLTNLIT